jgi:hypothetical protein
MVGCRLDDTGLEKLAEALTSNVSLEVLDVRNNEFTDNGASQFFDLLPQMKGLKSVYGLVQKSYVPPPTEAVGIALLDGLRKNTNVQQLFANNNLDGGTVDYFFSPGVSGNQFLSGAESPWSHVAATVWRLGAPKRDLASGSRQDYWSAK